MEYNTYDVLIDLVQEIKKLNEKLESLELKFFHFESKLLDVESKTDRILDITDGVSSSFGQMNVSPEQVQDVLNSFGLVGQQGGSEFVDTLMTFKSRLGELSSKLSEISQD
jgi:hypothetical protein